MFHPVNDVSERSVADLLCRSNIPKHRVPNFARLPKVFEDHLLYSFCDFALRVLSLARLPIGHAKATGLKCLQYAKGFIDRASDVDRVNDRVLQYAFGINDE